MRLHEVVQMQLLGARVAAASAAETSKKCYIQKSTCVENRIDKMIMSL
jgi:hypothetical protein